MSSLERRSLFIVPFLERFHCSRFGEDTEKCVTLTYLCVLACMCICTGVETV